MEEEKEREEKKNNDNEKLYKVEKKKMNEWKSKSGFE